MGCFSDEMDNNLGLQKAIANLRLVVGLGLQRDFNAFSLVLEVLVLLFFRGGKSRKENSKEN